MGNASRADLPTDTVRSNFPGPGSYMQDFAGLGPAWRFGNESRSKAQLDGHPGPGSYQLQSTLSKQAYSLSGRLPEVPRDAVPGPGTYGPVHATSSPTYKIGKAQRSDISGGRYDSPGPGAYHTAAGSTGPQYSMKGRQKVSHSDGVPGPGAYNADFLARPQTAKIGSAARGSQPNDSERNQFPGPGAYSGTPRWESPKWRFGSERRGSVKASDVPGPGSYQATSSLSRQAFSMSGRRQASRQAEVPGPGAYQPSSTLAFDSSPRFKMGTSSRTDLAGRREGPGPGAYSLTARSEGPQFSMKGRPQSASRDQLPGPGAYNTSFANKERPQSAWIGSSSRKDLRSDSQQFPGPGAYSATLGQASPQWKFGNGARKAQAAESNPGPGSYQLQSTLSKQGFSIGSRVKPKSVDQSPGPGAYSHQQGSGTATYRCGTAKRLDFGLKESAGPGPGAYSAVSKSFAGAVFSKSPRRGLNSSMDTPGPGSYMYKPTHSGSGWTIAGRYKRKPGDEVPGPGMYNPKKKGDAPHWGFGTGRRTSSARDESPGPAAYNVGSTIANLPNYALANARSAAGLRR